MLTSWRKKGSIDRLHNVVARARPSPARRELFKSKQKETELEIKCLYQLVIDGGVMRNSICDMLGRASKLHDALELYEQHFRNDEQNHLEDNMLTTDDTHELSQLLDLLKPVEEASLAMQSIDKDCHRGSLWESLNATDG